MMELPGGRKSFKIGLAILIEYQACVAQTDTQHRSRSKYRTYYVARVKSSLDATTWLSPVKYASIN